MSTVAHSDVRRAVHKRQRKKALRRRISARVTSMLVSMFSLMPRPMAQRLGRFVGSLAYRVARTDRRRAVRQLEEAFGDRYSLDERRSVVRRMFRHFGETAMDTILFSRWGPDRVRKRVTITGWEIAAEKIRSVLEEGNGAIVLSGHFGNWELLSTLLQLDFPGRVHAVARRYQEYGDLVEETRRRLGVKILYHDDSPRKILEVLKGNDILGILPDQDAKNVHGIFVEFFGKEAYTPSAPANFCYRVGTPIVPVFIARSDSGDYEAIAADTIRRDQVEGDEPVAELTRMWTRVLEERIRECPEQWVWTHKRWNTNQEVLDRRRAHERIRRERGW